ncbi:MULTISPECIES: sulfate ABC transporter permease subunit CysT [Rhizobium]|uniref:Sulfate transport system permease protein CysT n=1 Tax=Rhizobium esperanzae TaxID=1967781 RepID=A0A246DZR3_9HYPH|nr:MULTISPECIES: sulfate ABC transporter permease subunit CysT [Rhizobium]ANK89331.1 sulfate ABC transporter permease protein CysT [Rhizobium sp. N731]ANK94685.1 sulfate ABC transporter permease protein CysT [Rhizobium sp. N6212]ANL00735.1 sulfate ABC transporter permease protein CysT [Rhizobium sp. N621]ANL06856.1 sulfate ABC transporter permease protein CysT [Rhizobium esperanzae]ANL13026.1 sulfate ABC transporter permease protein CysT [Rhizobium sp. N1341]
MSAHSPTRWRFRRPSVIPGFGMALGLTLTWLTLLILIPLSGLAVRSSALGWEKFWSIALDPRTLNALRISFGTAFIAAIVNAVFGIILAWVLVRYRFPGKRVIDAMVDLPFALPTAVAGIALTTLYAPNGWVGQFLTPLGIKIAFTPAGIVIALIFVGLPFVVRTVQPVMEEIDKEVEEAAATLGANRLQTIFRVLLPGLAPAVLTGFALAFARGVGEYGSVIFIAGNLPFKSEIAPLLIVIKLEEYNYAAATGIAAIMLILSFGMLLVINLIQSWSRRRYGYGA